MTADFFLNIALLIITVSLISLWIWERRQPRPRDWITEQDHAEDMMDAMLGPKPGER